MGEGAGLGESGAQGSPEIQLCNLVAQGQEHAKGFRQEVERELTGADSEPWELVYFKLYKSQIAVMDQALETAALMLGSDRSRGYCLEMTCADFLAGANLDDGDPVFIYTLIFVLGYLAGRA